MSPVFLYNYTTLELTKKIFNIFWEFVESAVFALAIFVVAYLFFFQPSKVFGSSSYPTLKTGEMLFVEKVSYRLSLPQRGDFVVLKSPLNPDVEFIKRIVGLPTDSIRLDNCHVHINSEILDESYLQSGTCTGPESFLKNNQDFIIPTDSYFVMGDNRSGSSDSRDFGPILLDKIIGKAVFRIWPLDRAGIIY